MRAHFDTNVFDHIHKRQGVTDDDLRALRRARHEGRLDLPLHLLAVEEVVNASERNLPLAREELRLVLGLCRWDHVIVKPADEVVGDEIRAYAEGAARPSSFLRVSAKMRGHLNDIRDWRIKQQDLIELRNTSKAQTQAFAAAMEAGWKAVDALVKGPKKDHPTFDAYWSALGGPMAEAFAERCGKLAECRARGISGLLDQPAVRGAAAAGLSLAYAYMFEGVARRESDSRDMLHVTLAAGAADVFVSHDGKLRRIAERTPAPAVRVRTLPELLKELAA